MTPPMYERLEHVFEEMSLTKGYDVQLLFFEDPEDENVSVILFQPDGGDPLNADIGGVHRVMVTLIGARTRRRETTQHAQRILDFFGSNHLLFDCLGNVQPMTGLPPPMQSEEGRIIYQLPFACTFGE